VPLFLVLIVEVSGEEESYSAVQVGHIKILFLYTWLIFSMNGYH